MVMGFGKKKTICKSCAKMTLLGNDGDVRAVTYLIICCGKGTGLFDNLS